MLNLFSSQNFLIRNLNITLNNLIAISILVSGSLTWVFLIIYTFEDLFQSIITDSIWISIGEASFLAFIAFSAIIGSFLSHKISRKKLLIISTTMGIIATASIGVITTEHLILPVSIFLGVSLGLVYPSFMAFLAEKTIPEERGRVAGFVIFLTFIITAFSSVLATSFGLIAVIVIGVILRSSSYIVCFLGSCERENGTPKSWQSIFSHKIFSRYLFPWLIFNISSGLMAFVFLGLPQTSDYIWAEELGNLLHILGAGVFGLVGGFVADRFGRKQPVILGMVLLGVAFGVLGIAPSPLSLIAYLILSGVAWGFLIVVYTAVPGDVAFVGSKEKFYALGIILPLMIYTGLPTIAVLLNIKFQAGGLSAVLSIIMFLSILPVLQAKETLSKTKTSERKMKEYVDKVGKIIQESKKS